MKPNNPFLITGYHSPEYFCDRVSETQNIVKALQNGRNITLIAPRRIGKTGLIKNIFHKLEKENSEVITIYLDIFSTQNLNEFISIFANSVLGTLDSTSEKIVNRITKFIKSCRPIFTFDEITGTPSVSLELSPKSEQTTLKEIFEYLNSSEKRCYIAIDEFQQINEYPEKGVEALLRSFIQFSPNTNFIFSGSRQHVMQEMFHSAKRPFYQSTQTLTIDCIEKLIYYQFAKKFFDQKQIELSEKSFEYIYDKFNGHTWYLQTILNRLYTFDQKIEKPLIDEVIKDIIEESTYTYQLILSAYTANNIKLLKAIAQEGIIKEITSSVFIEKYKLGAASSVKTSLKKLIEKELAYKTDHGYIIYDRFMNLWLKTQPF